MPPTWHARGYAPAYADSMTLRRWRVCRQVSVVLEGSQLSIVRRRGVERFSLEDLPPRLFRLPDDAGTLIELRNRALRQPLQGDTLVGRDLYVGRAPTATSSSILWMRHEAFSALLGCVVPFVRGTLAGEPYRDRPPLSETVVVSLRPRAPGAAPLQVEIAGRLLTLIRGGERLATNDAVTMRASRRCSVDGAHPVLVMEFASVRIELAVALEDAMFRWADAGLPPGEATHRVGSAAFWHLAEAFGVNAALATDAERYERLDAGEE